LKVLTVNSTDITGGAAIAAYRLHTALLVQGIDSQMLVQNKSSDDYTVIGPVSKLQRGIGLMRPTIEQYPLKIYKNRSRTLYSISWLPFSGIVDKINEVNPDIVHLHWICGGMMRIEELVKIKAPIVWSLHDMWPFTGGCHYDEFCSLFQKDCDDCKVLGNSNCYFSKSGLKRKKITYEKIRNLNLLPTSKWISMMVNNSFAKKYVKNILPNPLDVSLFKKHPKHMAKKYFNIPKDKKVILFGASNPFSDIRKGFNELSEALSLLKISNVLLLIVGAHKQKILPIKEFEVQHIPFIKDEISLPLIYNAADVTVVPSIQETFGLMSLESLACGTPVVGFDNTGAVDIIDHKISGYIAKLGDSKDLCQGIEWVLTNNNYKELSKKAREKVVKQFDSVVVAKRYIELYREILNN
jgi:glycosyltransferase involved in cell wall biosynthesis